MAKSKRAALKPLSGLDAGFLYLEGLGTPMHVGSLMLLQRPKRRGYDFYESLLDLLAERLPRARVLRRVLQEAPLDLGHPVWSEVASVDLRQHVLRRKLRAPGGHAQLQTLVGQLHAQPLSRDRPLWQFVVIDGHESGQPILYSKIHHALLDGQGGVALARLMLDLEPRIPPTRAKASAKDDPDSDETAPRKRDVARASASAVFQQFGRLLRAVPETIKLAAAGVGELRRLKDAVLVAPRTPFNVQVGEDRRVAMCSLSLPTCKRLAKSLGVTLNDLILALCSEALRHYLLRHKALPEASLVAAMPISLRAEGDGEANNQVSMVQCTLASDIADPLQRLQAIADSTRQIKTRLATMRHLIPTDFPGLAAPIWATGLSRLWAAGRVSERLPPLANLAISNVPGPPVSLFLAGSELQHYYPLSIVTHGLALNITVHSYRQHLDFGLISCAAAIPRIDTLARGLERALATFEKAAAAMEA